VDEPVSIARHKGSAGEYSFERLRKDAIARLQELARNEWTDYNEHDPGVTILEALCYALTDVIYRADFAVADFLVDKNGAVDWGRQGLLPAEDVFPCRPTTELDYRTAILDEVKEVENVRLDTVLEGGKPTGLFRVLLRLRPHTAGLGVTGAGHKSSLAGKAKDRDADAIKRRVWEAFSGVRNLCNDIDSIDVIDTQEFELQAEVEIAAGRNPAEMLARIYNQCSSFLAAGIEFLPYDLAFHEGKSPAEMFCGPLTEAGMVTNTVRASKTDFPAADVYEQIMSVDGVQRATIPPSSSSSASNLPLQLHWPQREEEMKVKVTSNGRELKVTLDDLNMRFEELSFANRGMRLAAKGGRNIVPRPTGKFREFAEYKSVQHDLPPIYGVGPRGLPELASLRHKVSARQLRGFLFLFDQHLADLLATLAHLRDLYSTNLSEERTYFSQMLDEESFPGIDEVLTSDALDVLQSSLKSQKDHDRATRLIDYLLALYGEELPDDSLFHANRSRGTDRSDDTFTARLSYLKRIEHITRERGAASNFADGAEAQENRAGLEHKLSHLLGFENNPALHGTIRVVEHIFFRPPIEPFRVSVLFSVPMKLRNDQNFQKLAEHAVDTCCPAHIYADVYWLEASEMTKFDKLFRAWLECYGKKHEGSPQHRQSPIGSAVTGPHDQPQPAEPTKKTLEQHARAVMEFLGQLQKEGQ
jgi:hypothetical protein